MRFLEIMLALTLFLRISFHRRLPRWCKFIPVPVALLQVWVEGYRWQMLPLYFLTILAGIQSLRNLDPWKGQPPRWAPVVGLAITLPILFFSAALPVLLPIPKAASPTGPYAVGTKTLYLVDEARVDPYSEQNGAPRELLVQIWYPAEADPEAEKAPWMENAELVAPAIANWVELPDFAFDHLVYAKTSAYSDAPILNSGNPYPVVFFSHGFGGFRAQNTFQMQELASHGYVAVALEHTFASAITIFPDGRQALHNPDTLPDGLSDADYEEAAERLVAQWVEDLAFTLDTLATRSASPDDFFTGTLDIDKLGVMGHSTGGGAAVQFCGSDSRCRAGLVMDAWLLPVADPLLSTGLAQPFMYLYSEGWRDRPSIEWARDMIALSTGGVWAYSIDGTQHYDFTDLPAVSPLAYYFNLKGPIAGDRIQEMVNALTIAFFDRNLKGLPAPLLENPARDYPELQSLTP